MCVVSQSILDGVEWHAANLTPYAHHQASKGDCFAARVLFTQVRVDGAT